MVRVGGGWDTLSHYLDKHDPCRCKTGKTHFTKNERKRIYVMGGKTYLVH